MATQQLKFPVLHTESTAYNFVSLAKQHNQANQPYLFVNHLSAKHVPCHPLKAIRMFARLAHQLNQYYPERKLVIGVSEAAAAVTFFTDRWLSNRVYQYFQTTHHIDSADSKDYLSFHGPHDQGPEQYLPLHGLETAIQEAETIVFVDDELLTGGTVRALIRAMTIRFPTLMADKKFVAASIVNQVADSALYSLLYSNIRCLYLAKVPEDDFKNLVKGIPTEAPERIDYSVFDRLGYPTMDFVEGKNLFTVSLNLPKSNILDPELTETKLEALRPIVQEIKAKFKHLPKDVLVMGTEECIAPAILAGNYALDFKLSENVRVHSTTCIPIECTDKEERYPIQNGHWLPSVYGNYDTYLYDLASYDAFIIVSDADPASPGVTALWKLLSLYGATPDKTYYIHIN